MRRYDLYLSFTGGPALERLEREYGSPMARPLYCSVDPRLYFPEARPKRWDLGYMGTYSADRQRSLERLLLEPARRWPKGKMIVVGLQYPSRIRWPANVERAEHLPPRRHRAFYNAQRFTLNVTRADMVRMGYSPSVRLFEAAACATPIITDRWSGIDEFFAPGKEILVASDARQTLAYLCEMTESERRAVGERARALSQHTAGHRARELEAYARELLGWPAGLPTPTPAQRHG